MRSTHRLLLVLLLTSLVGCAQAAAGFYLASREKDSDPPLLWTHRFLPSGDPPSRDFAPAPLRWETNGLIYTPGTVTVVASDVTDPTREFDLAVDVSDHTGPWNSVNWDTDLLPDGTYRIALVPTNSGGAEQPRVTYPSTVEVRHRFRLSQQLGTAATRAVTLADLDSDGDLDLVTGSGEGFSDRVWFNDGAGIFTASGQTLGDTTLSAYDVLAEDFDGDGDVDLVITYGGYMLPERILGFTNDGSGWFTVDTYVIPYSGGASRRTRLAAADFNGDGALDLATTNIHTTTYTNAGPGIYFNDPTLHGWIDNSNAIALGDLDGDTVSDMLVTGSWNAPPEIHICDGAGGFSFTRLLSLPARDVNDAALGDLDGDGDLDVLILGWQFTSFLNDGNGEFTLGTEGGRLGNITYSSARLVLADLDGDSDVDALVGSEGLSIYENDGAGVPHRVDRTLFGLDILDLAVGDLNGDGKPDVVAATSTPSDPGTRVLLAN